MTTTDTGSRMAGTDDADIAHAVERLREIRRILAEDRAAFHRDVIAVSTGRPVPADPEPAPPGPVNNHPGPDFAPIGGAA